MILAILRKTLTLVLLCCATAALAQPAPDAAIRAVLHKQVVDWNRGDLAAFEQGYKNSPDIIFIGQSIRRGYAGMAAAYAKGYATPEARGVLSFTDLEVRPLDARFATVLGRFHLERTAAGGGNADGIFSLIFERTDSGWKIVLDHTTSTMPRAAAHP